jgi:dihydrofolate synthase / folylpolyglutamate synthase
VSTPLQEQYKETIEYLYAQLPLFSKYGKGAIKMGLDNITALCAALDNPQDKLKIIHVAGTNGKGSTSHMLSAVLQEAGYKTGLYTSPHIKDFGERLKINGELVSQQWIVDFVAKHKALFEQIEPSFFEVTVAMAFQYFADQECDIVVIETGLGGRLDSTNIVNPILSVITNISYDHMDVLGDTLAAIAEEKAGIIKKGIPFVLGERQKETEQVFFEHAIHKQCNCLYADAQWALVKVKQDENYQYLKAVKLAAQEMFDLKTDLLGAYQLHNIKTVLTTTEVLYSMGYNTDLNTTLTALSKVKKLTGLRGRWETLSYEPLIIADVGHNKAGVQEVMKQWKLLDAPKKSILIGFVKDKDVKAALSQLPIDHHYYFCNANIPRALPAEELQKIAEEMGLVGNAYPSVAAAVKAAQEHLSADEALLITGSFFVVGEAIEFLEGNRNE